MAERAALLIAVETPFEVGTPLPYATADITDLHAALPDVGYRREKCLLATGNRATKAALDSLLRRLPKLIGKVDSLIVVIATRAFSHKGHGYLVCTDTLAADPCDTALSLADLLAALHRTRCRDVAVLLDTDALTSPTDFALDADAGLDADELAKRFDESPACVGLLPAAPGERSHESGTLRHGIWRHHLLEAFTGQARLKGGPDGTLTAAQLQTFLEDAVPRTLRRSGERADAQHPTLYGEAKSAAVVADLSCFAPGPESDLLDASRLRRVLFRSESGGRVKDLAGFRKSHGLPERVNDWARKFVARIAAEDVQADLAATFESVREAFGYRRKDIDLSTDDGGMGTLHTPDFEYNVSVHLDATDPTEIVWRRDVGRFSDAGFVRSPAFETHFGKAFDQLVFEFAVPVDVAAFVDRLEDNPLEGCRIAVGSDANACDITLAGFVGKITLTRQALVIEGRATSSAGLLDQFLAFLAKFGPLGESTALARR